MRAAVAILRIVLLPIFNKESVMSDQLIKSIDELKESVHALNTKIENMRIELVPISRIVAGNGKPGLEARLYHLEQEMSQRESTTNWAMRTAVISLMGALGTVVWSLIQT